MQAFQPKSNDFKPLQPIAVLSDSKKTNNNFQYWRSLGQPLIVNELGAVWNVDFQKTSPYHYAVTSSSRVKIYDAHTNDEVRTLSRFHDTVYSAKFRSDGQLLVAGNEDSFIRIFQTTGRVPLRIYKGHKQAVRFVDFSQNTQQIFSGSDDKTVRLWDVSTEHPINQFNEHTDFVRCGTTIPSVENIIVTGSYDHTVRLFDIRTNTNTMVINHGDVVESVLAFPSKGILLSAGGTTIKMWDMLQGGRLLANVSNHHKAITCMNFNHDYTRVLSGSLDGHVKVLDIGTYQVVHDISYPAPVLSMSLSPDNDRILVVGMTNNTVSIRRRKALQQSESRDEGHLSKKQERKRNIFQQGQQFKAKPDDTVIKHNERNLMAKYDVLLRKFEHSKALDASLNRFSSKSEPQITVAVLEELIRRDALAPALANRETKQLTLLINFISKNICKPLFEQTLIEVACTLIDVYSQKWSELDEQVHKKFIQLRHVVKRETVVKQEMNKLLGCTDLIISSNQMLPLVANRNKQ